MTEMATEESTLEELDFEISIACESGRCEDDPEHPATWWLRPWKHICATPICDKALAQNQEISERLGRWICTACGGPVDARPFSPFHESHTWKPLT